MADDSARTIPATPRRREAARRAGLGAPADLPAWAASAAAAVVLAPLWARATLTAAAEAFRETCGMGLTAGEAAGGLTWSLPVGVVLPTLGLMAASAAAGLAVRLLGEGFNWQPHRAAPDLRRIDLLAGLQRIFSWATLGTFAISAVGLAVLGVAAVSLARRLMAVQALPVPPGEVAGLVATGWQAVAWLVTIAAAVAVGQWLLARRRFERQIRMTPQDLAEELKDLQADPRVRLLQREQRKRA